MEEILLATEHTSAAASSRNVKYARKFTSRGFHRHSHSIRASDYFATHFHSLIYTYNELDRAEHSSKAEQSERANPITAWSNSTAAPTQLNSKPNYQPHPLRPTLPPKNQRQVPTHPDALYYHQVMQRPSCKPATQSVRWSIHIF